jgi:general secretion pathway protein G
MATPLRNEAGFTIIELVAVLTIVAVLASVGLPMAELSWRRQQEETLRAGLRQIRAALDQYKRESDAGRIRREATESGYPPNLQVLVDGVADQTDPSGKRRLYFLRHLPRDPFANASLPAEATWAPRSYESPPDAPRPGKDVFDVHARTTGTALDGTRYANW